MLALRLSLIWLFIQREALEDRVIGLATKESAKASLSMIVFAIPGRDILKGYDADKIVFELAFGLCGEIPEDNYLVGLTPIRNVAHVLAPKYADFCIFFALYLDKIIDKRRLPDDVFGLLENTHPSLGLM